MAASCLDGKHYAAARASDGLPNMKRIYSRHMFLQIIEISGPAVFLLLRSSSSIFFVENISNLDFICSSDTTETASFGQVASSRHKVTSNALRGWPFSYIYIYIILYMFIYIFIPPLYAAKYLLVSAYGPACHLHCLTRIYFGWAIRTDLPIVSVYDSQVSTVC